MEALQQWGLAVCSAAVVGGIVQIISPDKAMGQVFRMSLGAFFLCCLLSPFLTLTPDIITEFDIDSTPRQEDIAQNIQQEMDEGFYTALGDGLRQAVQKKLEDLGILEGDITVYITEGYTTLTPEDMVAEIVLPETYHERHKEISDYLVYELGITIRIGYS